MHRCKGEGERAHVVSCMMIDITFAFGVFGGFDVCGVLVWSNTNRLCGVEMNFDHFSIPRVSLNRDFSIIFIVSTNSKLANMLLG